MGNASGLTIASLVLGILSLFFLFIPLLGQIIPLAAIIFGAVGLHKIKLDNTLTGKGMAIAGIILGAISLVTSVLIMIGMAAVLMQLKDMNLTQNITISE